MLTCDNPKLSLCSSVTHIINFGKVIIGKTYKKIFTPPMLMEIESIKLSELANPMDVQFEAKMSSSQKKIEITFTPERCGQYCCTYFHVVNVDRSQYYLNALGETEEIKIEVNKTNVTMMAQPGGRCKQYLKLMNKSKTPGVFQFIVDEGLLSVEPIRGRLNPFEYLYIVITFKSPTVTFCYKEIYCFIQYHAPLLIRVRAVSCHNFSSIEFQQNITFMEEIWQGKKDSYEQLFLEETFDADRYSGLIPLVISNRFLDLGSVYYSQEEKNSSVAFFTVKCQTPVKICIRWPQDFLEEFTILPKSVHLSDGRMQEFQVIYTPKTRDKFSHALLSPQILWGDNFFLTLPFYTTINLIGNSFDRDVCGWCPEYSIIPKSVKMPPAFPNFKVYSTIAIKNYSHLPIMFKVIPKKKSQFDIHPMQGVIDSEFQIFIIRMRTGNNVQTAWKEQWTIKLNTSFYAVIDLLGTVETPNIAFFSADTNMPPTNVNCCYESKIFIHNPTRLDLRFEVVFKEYEKCIKKGEENDCVHNNDITMMNITFCPLELGDYKTSFFVNPSCLNPYGEEVKGRCLLTLTGTGVSPSLSVVPQVLSCDDIPIGCSTTRSFILKNNGPADVCIEFSCLSKLKILKPGKVVLEPSILTLKNGEYKRVSLDISAEEAGYYENEISAVLLKSVNERRPVKKIWLLDLFFTIICPLLKIIDVQLSNLDHALNSYFSWKSLNIDGLNNAFAKLGLKNNPVVHCKVPEGEHRAKPIFFDLLVQNIGSTPCRFLITELFPCSCNTRRQSCVHKEVKFIAPKKILEVHETAVIKLKVYYRTVDFEKYYFKFDLGFTRVPDICSLELVVERFVIAMDMLSGDIPLPSVDGIITYNLDPVNIGQLNPPFQGVWLYNNTRAETVYKVTKKGRDSKYLSIINLKGIIKGKSFVPIVVRFLPIELREYKIKLNVEIGHKTFKLHVVANGVLSDSNYMGHNVPEYSLFENENSFPVILTMKHIPVPAMMTHAFTKYFITIKNHSDGIVRFLWSRYLVGGLVSISVEPSSGEIFPEEIMSCLVCVRTFSYPFKLTCNLNCKLTFPGRIQLWLNHRKKFEQMTKQFENQFTISDSIRNYSDVTVTELLTEPEPLFLSITLNVNCKDKPLITTIPPLTISGRYACPKWVSVSSKLTRATSVLLKQIMWEILDEIDIYKLFLGHQNTYYEDIYRDIDKIQKKIQLPMRCVSSFIDDTFYTLLCEMFHINPYLESNYNTLYPWMGRRAPPRCLPFSSLNNLYFKNVLAEYHSKQHTLFSEKYLDYSVSSLKSKRRTYDLTM